MNSVATSTQRLRTYRSDSPFAWVSCSRLASLFLGQFSSFTSWRRASLEPRRSTGATVWRRKRTWLSRHRAALMGAADGCGFIAMAGDDPHPLVELGGDVLGRTGFEKGDRVFPAGGKDALPRFAHFGRVRLARDRDIAERQAKIAWAQFGKAQARHGEDRLAIGDPLG